ncbi:hypothetical protein ACFV0O_07275 [Kitasatospora sp. NPDC059577]|uniref:hypothetical protein n=1 Tax=unclassified Kitasatospora TaxID=2633591 RepID=UPI00368EE040
MSLKTTRRATTARTFAGTVLTVALLVPAATACSSTSGASTAASPAATAATAGTPGTNAPAAPSSPAATAPASGAPTTPAAPPAKPGNGTTAAKPGTGATTTPAPPGKPAPGARTQTLPDGSTAEIREVAPQHFVAKIVNNGDVLATLDAKDTDAGLDANDMFIVLSLDGTVHAWMGGGHQGPGTFKVAGDWTVKVTKSGELKYRADILGLDNAVNGTLETNGHDVGVSANGVYIVLSAGGQISAHA